MTILLDQPKTLLPVSTSWYFHDKYNFYDYSNIFVDDRVKSNITNKIGIVKSKKTIEAHAYIPTDFIEVEWEDKEMSHPYPHQIAIDLDHRSSVAQTKNQEAIINGN